MWLSRATFSPFLASRSALCGLAHGCAAGQKRACVKACAIFIRKFVCVGQAFVYALVVPCGCLAVGLVLFDFWLFFFILLIACAICFSFALSGVWMNIGHFVFFYWVSFFFFLRVCVYPVGLDARVLICPPLLSLLSTRTGSRF